MGDEQRLSADELISLAREQFESATDFTVAVEEEFALLDPQSLDLTNRFEDVQAAARGTALEEHLVGELIASEVEVRTGKQASFADVPAAIAERRAQLQALVEPMGLLLGATGTHPWADWKEQRIIDTPHYRRNDELLRYVVWRNNTFGLHVHVAIQGAGPCNRGHGRTAELPPRAPRALGELAVRREREQRAPLGADADLHALLPPLRRARRVRVVGGVRELRPVPVRHALDHRAHADLVERPAAPRISDGGDQDLRRSARGVGGSGARRFRGVAHGANRTRVRRRRAWRAAARTAYIEENFWRAIRYGLSGELIDFERGEAIPARQRLEEVMDWILPAAEEIGAAAYLALPERNAAERQIERFESGAPLEEIYAEQVKATEAIGG